MLKDTDKLKNTSRNRNQREKCGVSRNELLIMHQHCVGFFELYTIELSGFHNPNQILKKKPTYKAYSQLYLARGRPPNVESDAKVSVWLFSCNISNDRRIDVITHILYFHYV